MFAQFLSWIALHAVSLAALAFLLLVLAYRQPQIRPALRLPLLLVAFIPILFFLLDWKHWAVVLPLPISWIFELIIILAGLALIRLITLVLFHLLLPLLGWSAPRIVEDIVLSLSIVGLGLVRLHEAGVSFGQIVTTSAILTAVIAFAMQDTLGNLLAGVAIQLDDSLRVGDWLEVDKVSGRVVEINWRATSIETRNWETVVVPNSMLLKQRFTVLGRRRGQAVQWRRWVWFDITLDTLPSQIIALVEKALQEAHVPAMASEPKPNCLLMSVENGIARYAVRYWLTDLQLDDPTDSTVRTLVDAALRRHDRRLTPPVFNIFMTKDNEKYLDARHKRYTAERVTSLRQLSLFGMLSEDELLQLAEQLKFTPFVRGDTMLEQGAISDWLYIQIRGEAEMLHRTSDGREVSLGRLRPGDFFGELGLLAGEATPFSVRALANVECYRVSREVFHELFLKRSELLMAVSQVLSTRMQEQQHLLQSDGRFSAAQNDAPDMLARLRSFFGM